MDKVQTEVVGNPAFFQEVELEATRLERSQSWILQRCLKASLPDLAVLPIGSEAVAKMKKSLLRNPIRLQSLRANVELASSNNPDLADLATAPKGMEVRMFYLPRDLYEAFDREGERLKLSADEILMWAWECNRDEIRSLPSVAE